MSTHLIKDPNEFWFHLNSLFKEIDPKIQQRLVWPDELPPELIETEKRKELIRAMGDDDTFNRMMNTPAVQKHLYKDADVQKI